MPLITKQRGRTRDLAGSRFGRLIAVVADHWHVFPSGCRAAVWKCKCDCGKEILVTGKRLQSGNTRSCGCLRVDTTSFTKTTHGHTKNRSTTPEYRTWRSMMMRCYDPKHVVFHQYGGQGITICSRWKSSFENFLADMGKRPKGKSIERINTRGNYEPVNCRWATSTEQGYNKICSRLITAFGRTLCLSEFARQKGLSPRIVRDRIFKLNWSTEKALSTPSK